ncbi:MAG: hypothetical protein U0Z17_01630 [Bacteroidales bacterium]
MKTNRLLILCNSIVITVFLILFSNHCISQVTQTADTLKAAVPDTLKTTKEAAPKPEAQNTNGEAKKDKKGKKNEIILYAGTNFTELGSSGAYESNAEPGLQLGAYYKQGRLFYWQAGFRYANAQIGYKPGNSPAGTEFEILSVSEVDIPLTLGTNVTSFMNRLLSVRIFASAVPSFTVKVADNSFGIKKENVNSFILYGQGGLGINVAFMIIEAGYNYGFNELLEGNTDSKPGQFFINLGFRF